MGRFDREFKRGYGYADHGKNRIMTVLRLLMICTAATLAAVIILALSELFRIKHVEVVGSKVYPDNIIISVSGIREGDSYGGAKIDRAEELLRDGLPYIKNVSVEKRFPANVRITVEEYPQVYYTIDNGMAYALSDKLEVLAKSTDPNDYAKLNGANLILPYYVTPKVGTELEIPVNKPEDNMQEGTTDGGEEETTNASAYKEAREQKYSYIFDTIAALDESDFAGTLTELDVSSKYEIYFICNSKFKIKLGSAADLEEKLNKAIYIIKDRDNENVAAAVIDVSVPSTPTWRELVSLADEKRDIQIEEESETQEEETTESEIIAEG